MPKDQTTLESRITKLERKNRLLLTLVLGVPCFAFLLGAKADESIWKGKQVSAERIVLSDPQGQDRAVLALGEGGAGVLVLKDQDGRSRIVFTANVDGKHGPAMYFYSENDKPVLVAGTNKDSGTGSIDFLNDGVFKGGVGGSALDREQ